MTQYRAITIWQPWASLIANGWKRWEFRPHAPPETMWNTRIAIHAGKRRVDVNEVRALLDRLNSRAAASTGIVDIANAAKLLWQLVDHPSILPLSSVLCTAMMGPPMRNADLARALGVEHTPDALSSWGWPLSDVEVLEPFVPATGHQGWWNWGGA